METLNSLLSSLPNSELISEQMRKDALEASVIPDADGRLPGSDDYVATYDAYYAAYRLIPFLQAQSVVTATSSEGTSVSATPPNWGALIAYYHSMSHILSLNYSDFTVLNLPSAPYVKRNDMSGRDAHYGDVDTDLG